ncbi:MAG: hypothetical protein WAU21_05970 [Chitinophagales bacterium]|nr:hypothetical protein [Bacteroidota bacterium]
MQSKLLLRTFIFICFTALLSGCNLGPGEGGTASIIGKVKVLEYNGSGILVNEYYAADERVYIIYGDETFQSDEVRTSYEGSYRFEFLRKGDYTIYVYSDCPPCDGETQAILESVSITKNGEVISVPEITIEKH